LEDPVDFFSDRPPTNLLEASPSGGNTTSPSDIDVLEDPAELEKVRQREMDITKEKKRVVIPSGCVNSFTGLLFSVLMFVMMWCWCCYVV